MPREKQYPPVPEANQAIEALNDYSGTLSDLYLKVAALILQYGPHRIIRVDAGHNNVEFYIEEPKGE